MVRGLLEEEDEATPLAFVGSASLQTGVTRVVARIAETLEFDPFKKRSGSADDLFRELRARTEAARIFVLLVGDLGSHHSSVGEKVFRGFAIADPVAPFVIINDQDAKVARSFTLLHELAHIWLGQTGVSGTPQSAEPTTPSGKIEQFCNDVAGEFLLPAAAIPAKPADWKTDDKDQVQRLVASISSQWSVSEPMAAYRLNRLGWISHALYRELTSEYAARWAAAKARDKEKAKEGEGGPSYYTVQKFKLGNALIDVVRRTLRDNALTHTKAAKMLGVKPGLVEPLLRSFEKSRSPFLDHRG